MKKLSHIVSAAAIVITITGCYSHKERIVEREVDRPVVRERVVEKPSTTIQDGDTTIKVK
jgi:hypothetical protein